MEGGEVFTLLALSSTRCKVFSKKELMYKCINMCLKFFTLFRNMDYNVLHF